MSWLKSNINTILIGGISSLIPFFVQAQHHNVTLNKTFNFEVEKEVLNSTEIIHSSFKPFLERETKSSLFSAELDSLKERKWVARKLFHEHFVKLDTGNVHLTIDPLFNFELSKESESDPRDITLFKNTRGFNLKLELGKKVAFESSFRENQANLPLYLNQRTLVNQVAYGQGRVKAFKEDGYDFSMASAYVSYSPSERINLQVGHGKHFVGQGHRSLLLSDVAFNYPYLKINTNWFNNKVQYQNLYTIFQDLNRLETIDAAEGLFERKQGAFHYLEFSPNHKWSFALFEGVIFPSLDTSGNIGVGANFWAPVLFLNTLIEGSENEGNTLIGSNFSMKLGKRFRFYNQLAIFDEKAEQLNVQLGAKWFVHKNIMLQGEFNSVAQSTGTNLYNHYNESLAYPVNREVSELIGIAQFKKKRWLTRGQLNLMMADTYDVQFADFRQSYVVNPSFNFTVHVGAQIRNWGGGIDLIQSLVIPTQNSTLIYFGLSTNLQNLYFDY